MIYVQNAWVLNQEILIYPELYHPCNTLMKGYKLQKKILYFFLCRLSFS